MNYTILSLAEVRSALGDIAREAATTFGELTTPQLNWRPEPGRWSAGECFEHLLTANTLMQGAAEGALDPAAARTIWQRLPLLPGWIGPMMVRSQAPESTRKFKAPSSARPAGKDVASDIVQRFVEQHAEVIASLQGLAERQAAETIMASPFIRVVTYTVLDGYRLMVAHDHRHVEQARRVILSAGFPGASPVA